MCRPSKSGSLESAWLSNVRCCEGGIQLPGILVRGYAVFPVKLRPVSQAVKPVRKLPVFALLIAISITLILFTTVLVITQRLLGL